MVNSSYVVLLVLLTVINNYNVVSRVKGEYQKIGTIL